MIIIAQKDFFPAFPKGVECLYMVLAFYDRPL